MFAFDEQNNNGQNINLNPIFQHLNSLDNDVGSLINDIDGISSSIGAIVGNLGQLNGDTNSMYGDVQFLKQRDAWMFGEGGWTDQIETTNGFLSDIYDKITQTSGGGVELFTSLNYNYNVDGNISPNDVINAAFDTSNKFKSIIELIGNFNFSNATLSNGNFRNVVLKNKNYDNIISNVVFSSLTNNKLIDIEGFKTADLKFTNINGDVRIKNIIEARNINCSAVKNLILKNIDTLRPYNSTVSFRSVSKLKIDNVSMYVDNDMIFNEIKFLDVNNATINGNDIVFSNVYNANFNNVSFDFDNGAVFNNVFYAGSTKFNNFEFKNCTFGISGSDINFNGIHGLIDDCKFTTLNFNQANNINLNLNNSESTSRIEIYVNSNSNYLNFNNYFRQRYLFNVNKGNNTIKLNYKYLTGGSPSITIDEISTKLRNVYSFENINYRSTSPITLSVIYGNYISSKDLTTEGNNPSIYLDKYCKLIFSGQSNNSSKLKGNTFDIYFNDVFNINNFDVAYFQSFLKNITYTKYDSLDFNTFYLHFNVNQFESVNNTVTITKKEIYVHNTKADSSLNPYIMNPDLYKAFEKKFFSNKDDMGYLLWVEFPKRLKFFNKDGNTISFLTTTVAGA